MAKPSLSVLCAFARVNNSRDNGRNTRTTTDVWDVSLMHLPDTDCRDSDELVHHYRQPVDWLYITAVFVS